MSTEKSLSDSDATAVEAELRRLQDDPETTKTALRLFMQSAMPCGHAVGNLLTCPDPPEGCSVCLALAATDKKIARLVEAAQALDAKLDAMEGPLISVCGIAEIHSAPYVGPQWTEERQALKAALADVGVGKETT